MCNIKQELDSGLNLAVTYRRHAEWPLTPVCKQIDINTLAKETRRKYA